MRLFGKEGECEDICLGQAVKVRKELILLTYMTYILPIQPTLFLRISDVVHIHISIRCDIIYSFPLIRIGGEIALAT